jgi:hypothetical protein
MADLIKIKRPGFAGSFRSIARVEVVDNKIEIGSTVLLFFKVKRAVIKLNSRKRDKPFFDAVKNREAVYINRQFGVFNSVSFFLSNINNPSITTVLNGLIYRLFILTVVCNSSDKYLVAFLAAHVCTGLY